ncbi:hypothetical protein Egran_03637 [Elaphomyces granulatus]|uniref:AMP-dependent synthetase/ligase domain-containing protein n=1 Tax=Elaphomyces granulatus TaxID=519963 RepID=A0A232LXQ8_9EURO|nr:hypothetical protein Egran_03637 [Elaphomyces granulatus]
MDRGMPRRYSLRDILTVASIHPFYRTDIRFPPSSEEINQAIAGQKNTDTLPLESLPLTRKQDLYRTIQRLCADDDPRNEYRRSSYISITGGGSGGARMFFLTDAMENRMHRATAGELMRICGVIEPRDWVITLHTSGYLYRALDLTAEVVENAGGTIFCAGHLMPHSDIVKLLLDHRINVLSGDSSQILQFALHVSSLPSTIRDSIRITKIFYTSEPLIRSQRAYLTSVFGPVLIFSVFASAESGPWAVMNLAVTGDIADDAADFIFDTRNIIVEVLPLSAGSGDAESGQEDKHQLPDGEVGVIALTSLQRLRNPLVRYVSGDLGSLHPLPANDRIPPDAAQHLKVFRLYGRDQRWSFKWQGEYFEFESLRQIMQREDWGVLQWQIVLRSELSSCTDHCEIRLLRGASNNGQIPDMELEQELRKVFVVTPINACLFHVKFVELQGFERSVTGGKVMRFVDQRMKGNN